MTHQLDGALAAALGHGIVPVVTCPTVESADTVADGLVAGGLPVAEVTLRTDAGLESIRRMAARGDLAVGAGTVTSPDQVDAVADAGASFVVSPGLHLPTVARAQELGLPVFPGVVTPSEVIAAVHEGLSLLKFFPAVPAGGVAMLKALAAPFPHVTFMPTGGIGLSNLGDFLGLKAVVAVGGSWMVPGDAVASGNSVAIADLASAAVAAAVPYRKEA